MTSGLGPAHRLAPPGRAAAQMPAGGRTPVGARPRRPSGSLPPAVAEAVRQGLADQLHEVFLIALPARRVALLATLGIKVMPLRETLHDRDEAGREVLDTLSQSAPPRDRASSPGCTPGSPAPAPASASSRSSSPPSPPRRTATTGPSSPAPWASWGTATSGGGASCCCAPPRCSPPTTRPRPPPRSASPAPSRTRRRGPAASSAGGSCARTSRSPSPRPSGPGCSRRSSPPWAERHAAVDVRLLFAAANDLGATLAVDMLPTTGLPARSARVPDAPEDAPATVELPDGSAESAPRG